jgi:hypothetical protein
MHRTLSNLALFAERRNKGMQEYIYSNQFTAAHLEAHQEPRTLGTHVPVTLVDVAAPLPLATATLLQLRRYDRVHANNKEIPVKPSLLADTANARHILSECKVYVVRVCM